jgi:hypothetical protein
MAAPHAMCVLLQLVLFERKLAVVGLSAEYG